MKTTEQIFVEQYGRLFSSQPSIRRTLIECSDKVAQSYADQFKPKWIPVEERLPEFGEDYNVVIDLKDGLGDPVVGSVEWDGVNKVFCYQGTDIKVEGITHWMPLPAAPERKEVGV